mmetsp:Transcript_22989/g.50123  ORF Transcript_22989/g.50123 Transcript_22989/m.50123 type:complete len:433 (+) Transcript_22989:841-2139(+)
MSSSVFFVLAIAASTIGTAAPQEQNVIYGTQCSFSITGPTLSGCESSVLDHRQEFYNDYMAGCYEYASKEGCDEEENTRHDMNEMQPQSMVNMTKTGYMKTKAPASLMKLLKEFWESNKDEKEIEEWGEDSIYTNHWSAPTNILSIEDENLVGGGEDLKEAIWDAAIDGITEWTGGIAKLRPVSLYGIREYTEGAVLSPHVDRTPLVSSGIVNVFQDVDEPWPLEVYDRNGHAVNITMEPGDMILYESHSLIHGRPFPLKGRSYASVFIHFEPFEGWDKNQDEIDLGDSNGDLPPYILPGSPQEEIFRQENPNGWSKVFIEGHEPPFNDWAAEGQVELLKEVFDVDPSLIHWNDENGWTPLHEAARWGHVDLVNYLIENGADINHLTQGGSSPLHVAKIEQGEDHKIVAMLLSLGAEDVEGTEEREYEEDEF